MRTFYIVVKWLLAILLVLAILDVASVTFFAFYRPPLKRVEDIIVLGAAINTPATYDRSLEGLALYEAGDGAAMVLSGGQDYPKSISEAEYMERVIESNTSDLVPLILEDKSQSTFENLENTRGIIGSGKSVIIVSDDFHLARAVLTAKRLGFNVISWASPRPTYYSKKELAYYYSREFLAMVDYLPKFIFGK